MTTIEILTAEGDFISIPVCTGTEQVDEILDDLFERYQFGLIPKPILAFLGDKVVFLEGKVEVIDLPPIEYEYE